MYQDAGGGGRCRIQTVLRCLLLIAGVYWFPARGLQGAETYYRQPPLFSTVPSPEKSVQTVARFGPVGIGIDLVQPAFVMRIKNVEPESPAARTGKFKPGQIIETINGESLRDIDPRIQLGNILAAAEATDGVLDFVVKENEHQQATSIQVRIPVLGAYSRTWPLNCPKSDKIVRGFASYLSRPDSNKGFAGFGMLFLLSTGDDRDLPVVRQWARSLKGAPTYAWHLGYGGIPLTEYYLRTGDASVLPTIQRWVDSAVKTQYFHGWAGRGGVAHVTYGGGGGHLNAGGTAVVTFLLLAKECGVEVPDHALLGALTHFYRWAGRGNNPYGNNKPELGFVDNGKNGNLAFAMAAAASLTPDGERSIYAGARDAAAMTSFYTTTFMLHGHTGGGIGEIWRGAAMGLLYDKKSRQYREFMDHRKWHYDLSRRFDGSFGILGGARYDHVEWGAGYAMSYTIPRKTLQITGAPRSPYAKSYQLPQRPWGTAADDAFASIGPAVGRDGWHPDFSGETLANDSGRPLLNRLSQADVSDDVLRRYAHHPDPFIRLIAARRAMGVDSTYLGRASGRGEIRRKLAHDLLQSPDPRVRRALFDAMANRLEGAELVEFLGPEGVRQLFDTLADSRGSWWVKEIALKNIGRLPTDLVHPQLDLILPYLQHEEWWLRESALVALTPVVADERCYRRVLPAMGEMLRTTQVYNATRPIRWGDLPDRLRHAGPAVQQLAAEVFEGAFTGYAGVKTAPGGQNITTTYDSQIEFLASVLTEMDGGYDVLYKVARERFPNDPLPYADIFLNADWKKFGPELRQAIRPIIRDRLIYQYIGKHRRQLWTEIAAERQNSYVSGAIDGLVDLYDKLGIDRYHWHPFGPDLRRGEWDYFCFDPPEQLAYDVTPWRYRAVTYPPGMEHWFAPDFEPKRAGWQRSRAPFGQFQGKLVTQPTPCSNPRCAHADPMRTLWDKEVLLLRGTFQFPSLRPNHLYRIRVGSGQHVGSGDGYRIYINGRQLLETKVGVGRRQGARPRGAFITREFLEEFHRGPVTIAATSFLRFGSRAIVTTPPVPQGIFSLWVEEMELPPVNDEAVIKSATVIPMTSSDWQAVQDPDQAELRTEDDLFHYDGRFVPNPRLYGNWTVIGQVARIEDFDPDDKVALRRPAYKTLTFDQRGRTNNPLLIWSGAMLFDLDRYQALKMTERTIDGAEYLFVEVGGFSDRHPAGWTSPWYVLTRSAPRQPRVP